ncbi:MAG: GNAT family N-acetyltransferase [Thaumarchaeota archaeon]|nr:GNAT family N-acetyltransferase [Nitrososphaerota archaeon]
MVKFSVQELGPQTWPDFVRIMEKHNGVWGGCWCVSYHLKRAEESKWTGRHRELKQILVQADQSHAALVYSGTDVVGWCQFGQPIELPARMTGYGKLGLVLPDWRVPCFFVDRDRRKEGVADAALKGALRIIAAKGGGTVDGYPIATKGKPYSSSFLWGGTDSMFTEAGFRPVGRLGTSKLVMRKAVRGLQKTKHSRA